MLRCRWLYVCGVRVRQKVEPLRTTRVSETLRAARQPRGRERTRTCAYERSTALRRARRPPARAGSRLTRVPHSQLCALRRQHVLHAHRTACTRTQVVHKCQLRAGFKSTYCLLFFQSTWQLRCPTSPPVGSSAPQGLWTPLTGCALPLAGAVDPQAARMCGRALAYGQRTSPITTRPRSRPAYAQR
jgi:hypothetical protein